MTEEDVNLQAAIRAHRALLAAIIARLPGLREDLLKEVARMDAIGTEGASAAAMLAEIQTVLRIAPRA